MSINPHDDVYHALLRDVLENGVKTEDRTGVGTLSVFGRMMKFDLMNGFPLITTKKMYWKTLVSELLWFIEGSTNERRLAEILYGKPHSELRDKTTIWTANAKDFFDKGKAEFEGDLGAVYAKQWRRWDGITYDTPSGDPRVETVDQLANLIEGIKKDPHSRRHILSAWNVGEIENMALPPCHVMSQYYVQDGKLSCMMTQRSADIFLGEPYNIASYALLTTMIAHICGLKVGELTISIGDCHIYLDHIDQVKEQLSRKSYPAPIVSIVKPVETIDDFTMDHFSLFDYKSHPSIKAKMAV